MVDSEYGEEHEGYVAMLEPDGRGSDTTNAIGIVFFRPAGEEVVPWSTASGWRVQCECGWRGTSWSREDARKSEPARDEVDPEDKLLPDGRTLEEAGREERHRHAQPFVATAHQGRRGNGA